MAIWFVTKFVHCLYRGVREVTTDDVAADLRRGGGDGPTVLLLDVRAEDEHAVSHIKGSVRVPMAATVDEVREVMREKGLEGGGDGGGRGRGGGHKVICYCSVGYRSSVLAARLSEGDVGNVCSMEGGIFQWVNDGKAVVAGPNEEPADKVHTFNKTFGYLVRDRERRVC